MVKQFSSFSKASLNRSNSLLKIFLLLIFSSAETLDDFEVQHSWNCFDAFSTLSNASEVSDRWCSHRLSFFASVASTPRWVALWPPNPYADILMRRCVFNSSREYLFLWSKNARVSVVRVPQLVSIKALRIGVISKVFEYWVGVY